MRLERQTTMTEQVRVAVGLQKFWAVLEGYLRDVWNLPAKCGSFSFVLFLIFFGSVVTESIETLLRHNAASRALSIVILGAHVISFVYIIIVTVYY
jgi:hypothetical protein